ELSGKVGDHDHVADELRLTDNGAFLALVLPSRLGLIQVQGNEPAIINHAKDLISAQEWTGRHPAGLLSFEIPMTSFLEIAPFEKAHESARVCGSDLEFLTIWTRNHQRGTHQALR